jgi:hypothetical protein
MTVAEPMREEARLDRRVIRSDFARAIRHRACREKRPAATLGDVIEAVASETGDTADLVAVVARVFSTRKVLWASSSPAGPETWLEDCNDPSMR